MLAVDNGTLFREERQQEVTGVAGGRANLFQTAHDIYIADWFLKAPGGIRYRDTNQLRRGTTDRKRKRNRRTIRICPLVKMKRTTWLQWFDK